MLHAWATFSESAVTGGSSPDSTRAGFTYERSSANASGSPRSSAANMSSPSSNIIEPGTTSTAGSDPATRWNQGGSTVSAAVTSVSLELGSARSPRRAGAAQPERHAGAPGTVA